METGPERELDLRGKACPLPVVETRNALNEAGGRAVRLRILVDNPAAAANVTRFAASQGCAIRETRRENGDIELRVERDGDSGGQLPAPASASAAPSSAACKAPAATVPGAKNYLLYLDRETMGTGDERLGRLLLKAFLQTLPELEGLPRSIILVNGGVKLALAEAPTLTVLQELERAGCELLVCGTCLDFYHLKDKLEAGRVSNMFEIAGLLCGDQKVVRP